MNQTAEMFATVIPQSGISMTDQQQLWTVLQQSTPSFTQITDQHFAHGSIEKCEKWGPGASIAKNILR